VSPDAESILDIFNVELEVRSKTQRRNQRRRAKKAEKKANAEGKIVTDASPKQEAPEEKKAKPQPEESKAEERKGGGEEEENVEEQGEEVSSGLYSRSPGQRLWDLAAEAQRRVDNVVDTRSPKGKR